MCFQYERTEYDQQQLLPVQTVTHQHAGGEMQCPKKQHAKMQHFGTGSGKRRGD